MGPPYVVATTLLWRSLPDGINRLSPNCALLRACFFTFRTAQPILRSETDIAKAGRVEGRVLSLLAPAGVHKRKSAREADPRGELISHDEIVEVGLRLNFGTQLCPRDILRRTAEMHVGIDMPHTDRCSPVARLQVAATFRTI